MQVLGSKGWLPGVDSNHNNLNSPGICKLRISKRPRMPSRTRNPFTGSVPAQQVGLCREHLHTDDVLGCHSRSGAWSQNGSAPAVARIWQEQLECRSGLDPDL